MQFCLQLDVKITADVCAAEFMHDSFTESSKPLLSLHELDFCISDTDRVTIMDSNVGSLQSGL